MFVLTDKIAYLYGRKPKVGRAVAAPLWCQRLISIVILTFQTLKEMRSLIGLWVFIFHLLSSRFSVSPVFMLQRYTGIGVGCKFFREKVSVIGNKLMLWAIKGAMGDSVDKYQYGRRV